MQVKSRGVRDTALSPVYKAVILDLFALQASSVWVKVCVLVAGAGVT